MKTQMKFNHDCKQIEGAVGYTEERWDEVMDKTNGLIRGVSTNHEGHQPSRLIEALVKSDLTRDDLAIVIVQALRRE